MDDIERRGDGLSIRDVLGLVNNLNELKNCKVCLILNEEALDKHEAEYRRYLEKMVDATLTFQPSPEECARIALSDSTTTDGLLAQYSVKLGISNIRVIKKIQRSIRQIEPPLASFDPAVWKQAVHSLTLFGWSLHEPTLAPPREFIKKKKLVDFLDTDNKKSVPPDEAAWLAVLNAYEFTSMDDFDLALLSGVRDGFFDKELVIRLASEMDTTIKAGNLDAAFQDAWNMFHDSFDDNANEVLDAMYESFFKAVRYITPMNLSSTVSVFKALGQQERALSILNHYVESRADKPEIFNLRNNPFTEYVRDPDVIRVFEEKYASFKKEQKPDPATILLRIAETNSWNPEDIKTLSMLPVPEYHKLFKSAKGYNLRQLIKTCFQFGQFGNATEDYLSIAKKAKEALATIAEESAINTLRAKTYGIEIETGS
jgi:hypothetical protein